MKVAFVKGQSVRVNDGPFSEFIGTVGSIVLGGAVSIAAAGFWALFFPGLRNIDRFEDIAPGVDPDAA